MQDLRIVSNGWWCGEDGNIKKLTGFEKDGNVEMDGGGAMKMARETMVAELDKEGGVVRTWMKET